MRHNSSREHGTEGQRGRMAVFLSVCLSNCWSLCIWVGTLTWLNTCGSLRRDVVKQIISEKEWECIILWWRLLSADHSSSWKNLTKAKKTKTHNGQNRLEKKKTERQLQSQHDCLKFWAVGLWSENHRLRRNTLVKKYFYRVNQTSSATVRKPLSTAVSW